ncbi:MAG: PrsW family intramembrane metalloprotease [Caldilineaceae bacterium]|nr:PrsW family intramembrane metalloprotease [Caldilineaceae bacterium]
MLLALIISLVAATVPTLLYVLLFYWADRYEREPRWLVIVAFFWGALPAIVISLIAELAVGEPFITDPESLAGDVVSGSLVAPIVEELVKGAALFAIFWWKRQEFDGVLDGIVYGALIGFGFAMTENLLYFVGAFDEGGFGSLSVIIYLRSILFGLNHAFYTSLIGIGLGIARHKRTFAAQFLWAMVGLAAGIFAHVLHNLGASLAVVNVASFGLSLLVAGAGLAITLLAIGLSWQQERNIISTELSPEVGRLLSQEEYGQLTGQWRPPNRAQRLPTKERRQLLVEYANRRFRLRRHGLEQEPELAEQLAELQTELATGYSAA